MPHRSGRHRGEFEGDSPTEEVAAQIRLRGTDPVQLRAQANRISATLSAGGERGRGIVASRAARCTELHL